MTPSLAMIGESAEVMSCVHIMKIIKFNIYIKNF